MENELINMIKLYQELLDQKEEMDAAMKALTARIRKGEGVIVEKMLEENCPALEVNGRRYSCKITTKWNKLSDEKLIARGIITPPDAPEDSRRTWFDFLRDNNLGSLIKETVNAASLQTALNAEAKLNDGELPGTLAEAFSPYDIPGINVRKVSSRS